MPVTVEGTVNLAVQLGAGEVRQHPDPLKVNVLPFKYDIGGLRGTYAGVLGQSCTDDDTTYLYLDDEGTLQVNTTGFPTGVIYLPLARVVCANGEIAQIYEERILLAATPAAVGTCVITLPVDGDVRGGDTSASSNNDWAAVKYEQSGTGEARNRLVRKCPRNYVDDDVTVRVVYSLASSAVAGQKSRWEIQHQWADLADALGTMATIGVTHTHTGEAADTLYSIDLTIPEANVGMDKEFMAFQINRDNNHADDTLAQDIYVHNLEIRYNGRLLAGQAGQ